MRLVTYLALLVTACLGASALAQPAAQPSSGATRSVTYGVSPVGESGVSGVVFIGEYGPATTAVVIALRGTQAGGDHPAHFHAGSCGSGGGIVVPLSNVEGASGLSLTLTDVAYDDIVGQDHYLNVHLSPDQMGEIVACGEVGVGAGAFAGQIPGAVGTAMTPVRPQEFGELRTASYGLFPVEGSGVSGTLQVAEQLDGSNHLILTMQGIEEGRLYPAALYRGDCGPDREVVLELSPVGGGEVILDPFSSVTQTTLSFGEITEGDHFAYVFVPDGGIDRPATFGLDTTALACGEVGFGANR
jgi:hypothetical protein